MKHKHMMMGVLVLGLAVLLSATVGFAGLASSVEAAGPASPVGATAVVTATQPLDLETCTICHKRTAVAHQASYEELYQDGVIQITDLKYAFTDPGTTVVAFKMTKDGAPFNAKNADNLNIYFAPYTGSSFEAPGRLSLKGKLTYDAASGVSTSTLAELAADDKAYIDYTDVSSVDGLLVVFGRDEDMGTLPARIALNKYPFAAILQTGKGVDYVSAANDAGCVKCHTDPYLKHGYIYAQVNKDPATDFLTCKACHFDNGAGGHFEWQLLVDNPELAAKFLNGEVELTPEQEAQYAYKTTLMNDVHMSHAMEFPYPQSMANCATCHEGKLDVVLSDANFKIETCKSCHPMTGAAAALKEGQEEPSYDTTELALKTILPEEIHKSLDLNTTDCTMCHKEGGAAPSFKQIHTGYDQVIYTADGLKYSDALTLTIDSAAFDGKVLTFEFSAHKDAALADLNVASITPTVLVGLYGWDTRDYIVGPHERLFDDNGDGAIDSKDARSLEVAAGAEHPRIKTVSAADGKWSFTADLSAWADLIADGTVKRVEIGVMPALNNADGVMLALNAPSRTFDLGANKFADKFYSPITKIADGCNTCHDALATTFHTPDRGGNAVVCRLCHITKAGGSHLELQSRSLDSYVHAIHSFQAFDVGAIDFADPVAALEYEHHINFPYPKHGLTDCESCHVKGAYDVPNQAESLPGLISATSEVKGMDRSIGAMGAYVTGPGARICGSCHRATLVKEDNAGDLAVLNTHFEKGGYVVPAGEKPLDTLMGVIDQVMEYFK